MIDEQIFHSLVLKNCRKFEFMLLNRHDSELQISAIKKKTFDPQCKRKNQFL